MGDTGGEAEQNTSDTRGLKRSVMLLPWQTGSPIFDGKGVTDFWERYEALTNNSEVTNKERAKGMLWYLSREPAHNIYAFIQIFEEWDKRNWERTKEILVEGYPDTTMVEKYTVLDLRHFVKKIMVCNIALLNDLTKCNIQFQTSLGWLAKVGRVTMLEQAQYYFQGLSTTICNILENQNHI